jgi:hypothetical protein
MKQAVAILFCIIGIWASVQAQTPKPEQIVGTWIGVRIEYDEQFSRPYPVSMKLDADSSYTLRLIDENPPARQATWSMTTQKIRLDTNVYALDQWILRNNELKLSGAYPIIFRRLTDTAIDSSAVRETLRGYIWETDSLTYHFHRDGSVCLENPKTGNVAVHCWHLAQVSQSTFLVIKGNENECTGNFQYPQQVTSILPDRIEFLGGKKGADQLVFRRGKQLESDHHCQPKGFQPCNAYVLPYTNLYPYFTYRRGRLYDIRQVVERDYKPVLKAGESGLIRFRFIVNCRGEAGNFELLEVDENYQKCAFDSRITNQLLNICRNKLTDWEPGKRNDDQTPVDTFCLLTFQLKDGLITNIFP